MPVHVPRDLGAHLAALRKSHPVITLTGPRQSGKTTLCRMLFGDLPYVSLEDPDRQAAVEEDPRAFLASLPEGGVIDEFQRCPDLTRYLQGVVDDPAFAGLFVLTGSRNLAAREAVNQSLAGRTALACLLPFTLGEIDRLAPGLPLDRLLFSGGFPRIHHRGLDPRQALADYVGTYVERDLRQLSMVRDLSTFQTFLGLCAGRTGQILNLESLGNDAGIARSTAVEWLSFLEASYICFRLPPYFANLSKRLIKSPKLYFHDVGLACHLVGVTAADQLHAHPLRGALFENLVVTEVLKHFHNRGPRPDLHFYRDSHGNEVDLVIPRGNSRVAVEIKAGMTVNRDFFKGLERFAALFPEEVDRLLVYAGDEAQRRNGTRVVPLANLADALEDLAGKVRDDRE